MGQSITVRCTCQQVLISNSHSITDLVNEITSQSLVTNQSVLMSGQYLVKMEAELKLDSVFHSRGAAAANSFAALFAADMVRAARNLGDEFQQV